MTKYINAFPGYEFKVGKDNKPHNMYKGIDVGFGGYVYAEPGMYGDVALLDVGNMHGKSIIALNKFGPYTKNFIELREARMAIKAGDYDKAKKMLDGKLESYLNNPEEADKLQQALKLILNSTYGIAAATFDNPLRDNRDKNNIIALRGALFMVDLMQAVQEKGFTVAHIKTDSIKIPDATQEIIKFVMDFGKKYGYEFEHEATYEKMCLVNDAVYIAKFKDGKNAGKWTATGAEFAQSYVFKTLFSKEDITFDDLCETKSVNSSLYLDMNEDLKEDEHNYMFIGKVGRFCPIYPGCGGGILLREKDGKYYAATGTKGYRWLESEMVKNLKKEKDIDISYYDKMVEDAIKHISDFGDFEWFVSDKPYNGEMPFENFMNKPADTDLPPWNN